MSGVKLRQINKQFVRAIPIPNEDTRPIKGFDICEEPYANIFLCARKKSGKTSAVFKIIKESCKPNASPRALARATQLAA